MAEYREEPPPMIDGDDKSDREDDDLFTSAAEVKPDYMKESAEKDDIFAEANEELPLDSPSVGETPSVVEQPDQKTHLVDGIHVNKHSDDGEPPRLSVSESVPSSAASSKPYAQPAAIKSETIVKSRSAMSVLESRYVIEITIKDAKKVGDGMNAYMAYRVLTKTNIPDFRHTEMEVYRRFSDFLGLHEKLTEKHLHHGCIIPPPPEKSVIGMTKIKMSKEDTGSTDFVEQRRAALERFVNCIAKHPVLQTDPSFVDFLEVDGDLPRATSTSALSSAGVLRLFKGVGESFGKISYKMDESDQWFETKQLQIDTLDVQLRKLHSSLETLVANRKELAQSTGLLANGIAMLGSAEEDTSLARALSQLAEVIERVDHVYMEQSNSDLFVLTEFIRDHVGLVQAIKEVFHERVKTYKTWKDDEATLHKKREAKSRFELAQKMDKISAATHEISEWEHRVEKSQEEFESISKSIVKEVERFELQRYQDFKATFISFLESLMNNQQQLIKYWEMFLPEAKAIA